LVEAISDCGSGNCQQTDIGSQYLLMNLTDNIISGRYDRYQKIHMGSPASQTGFSCGRSFGFLVLRLFKGMMHSPS
jgi:hypothetical protein